MLLAVAVARAGRMEPTWTTVHLAKIALARGHRVAFVEPGDFRVISGRCMARAWLLHRPVEAGASIVDALANRAAPRAVVDVADIDVLLLRITRPDPRILTFSQIAAQAGVSVINDPAGALLVGHKGWLAAQPGAPVPPTLVTTRSGDAAMFGSRFEHVVIKPARGQGGTAVARVPGDDTRGIELAFQSAAAMGDGYVVIQRYVTGTGDVRAVWLDGEVIGGYRRVPAEGEFRHNLQRGATAEPCEITPGQRRAIGLLSPSLSRNGIRLAGIDVIGETIIEINALNPGGAFHADRLNGTATAEIVVRGLERGRVARGQARDIDADRVAGRPDHPEVPT